jgi:hypothetical protein
LRRKHSTATRLRWQAAHDSVRLPDRSRAVRRRFGHRVALGAGDAAGDLPEGTPRPAPPSPQALPGVQASRAGPAATAACSRPRPVPRGHGPGIRMSSLGRSRGGGSWRRRSAATAVGPVRSTTSPRTLGTRTVEEATAASVRPNGPALGVRSTGRRTGSTTGSTCVVGAREPRSHVRVSTSQPSSECGRICGGHTSDHRVNIPTGPA